MNINLSKTKKCKGCGLPLSTDVNNIAYTPNLALDYCQRCFRLKHYGINSHNQLVNSNVSEVLNNLEIQERDWIVIINDILNIDFDVINKYKDHKKICFVFNKADLLVNSFNYLNVQKRITKMLSNLHFKDSLVIISSVINNYGVRKIFEFITQLDLNEKVYFIGKTNSGKSSVINALIKYSGSVVKPLTISNYLNTTADLKQIKLLKHSIIDTPGYHSEDSILNNLVNLKDVGSLQNKQRIKPTSFQIFEPQSFIIDSLLWLTTSNQKQASIVFYLPNKLKAQRTKPENLSRNLKNPLNNLYKTKDVERKTVEFSLKPLNKYNLMVEGLGMISIKGLDKISINTFKNVKLTLLDDWII